VPARTRDLEKDFMKITKAVLVGGILFATDVPMEEKYSLRVLLMIIGQPLSVSSLAVKLLISENCI